MLSEMATWVVVIYEKHHLCVCGWFFVQEKNNCISSPIVHYKNFTSNVYLYVSVSVAGLRSHRGGGGCLTLPAVPSGEVGQ